MRERVPALGCRPTVHRGPPQRWVVVHSQAKCRRRVPKCDVFPGKGEDVHAPLEKVFKLGAKQHGAVSRAQVLSLGLTERVIDGMIASGRWRVLSRRAYALPGAPVTWEQRAMARALSFQPDGAISHLAAAALLGIAERKPERIDVTVPIRRKGGPAVHRARTFSRVDIRKVDGIPVTCPARTLIDLAGILTREPLEAALDTAILKGLVSLAAVRRYIDARGLGNRRGVALLRRLLDDRESAVPESELERKFERLVKKHSLPKPARQFWVGRRRIDYAYPEKKIAIELDGRKDHAKKRVFEADRKRQNQLVIAGWTPLRFTWDQLRHEDEDVAATIRAALDA